VKFSGDRRRRDAMHLDLTAMIDVVFQLVLFLLLATTFKKPNAEEAPAPGPGIRVDLPQSSGPSMQAAKQDLDIWVAADGRLFLGEQPIEPDALQQRFETAAAADAQAVVVIRADKGVPHGRVVEVMDAARRAGLTRMAIATQNEPGGAAGAGGG
jgi:biopolymer transport protein ExbD